MALFITSVLVIEWVSKNGWHQCMYPQGKFQLLPASPVSLQDQQVGLTLAPFKSLLLHWVPDCVKFCVHFKNGVSCLPESLSLPKKSPVVVLSLVWLCSPMDYIACQGSLLMDFSRQGFWSGVSFATPGDLTNPRSKPTSLEFPTLAGGFFTTSSTWEAPKKVLLVFKSKCSGVSTSQYRIPGLGSQIWDSDLWLFGEKFLDFTYRWNHFFCLPFYK